MPSVDALLTSGCYPFGMRFILIPVVHASPAVRNYLAATADDGPQTPAEVKQLVSVAIQFAVTSGVLVEYVRRLTGRPCEN